MIDWMMSLPEGFLAIIGWIIAWLFTIKISIAVISGAVVLFVWFVIFMFHRLR